MREWTGIASLDKEHNHSFESHFEVCCFERVLPNFAIRPGKPSLNCCHMTQSNVFSTSFSMLPLRDRRLQHQAAEVDWLSGEDGRADGLEPAELIPN